jgi:hypothetical protein
VRGLLVVLSVTALSLASCAVDRDGRPAKSVADQTGIADANEVELAPPGPLDDEWSRSLVGEWDVFAESDIDGYKDWVKGRGVMDARLGLGGQFLIVSKEGRVTQISDEYIEHLKRDLHTSDEEIEAMKGMTFGDIELHSIDPRTGQVAAWLFDSWRCVATGMGTREGNKETIQWKWSLAGGGTSIRTTVKVGGNRLVVVETYSLPDGGTMEDRVRMIRTRSVPSDSGGFALLRAR